MLVVVAAAAALVAGLLLRGWVWRSPFGALNADEAYTGLQAAEITGGRIPIVIQGSTYSAVFESYALAPMIAVFGQHVWLLKAVPVVIWGLASAAMCVAARPFAGRAGAAVAGALLWLAPGAMLVVSTRAYVGYALGMALVIVTLWACARALGVDQPDARIAAIVGAAAGLTFYVHPMYLAAIVPMLVTPCVVHRRSLRSWWAPAAIAAIAVNGPFLAWNARNGWPSLEQPVDDAEGPLPRCARFFTGLLPRAFGMRGSGGAWTLGAPLGITICLFIGAVVVWGAWSLVRAGGRQRTLGLLVVAPLLACWPLMALLANLSFVDDARYAVIPLPFLVLAVARAAADAVRAMPERLHAWARPAVVVVWVAIASIPFLRHDLGADLRDPNAATAAIIDELSARGVDRIAGYYWLVLPIEYQSDREIRSAVAGHPFIVRVPSSQRLVEQTPAERVAFVFDPGTDNPLVLWMPVESYERVEVAGAIMYVPWAMEAT